MEREKRCEYAGSDVFMGACGVLKSIISDKCRGFWTSESGRKVIVSNTSASWRIKDSNKKRKKEKKSPGPESALYMLPCPENAKFDLCQQ